MKNYQRVISTHNLSLASQNCFNEKTFPFIFYTFCCREYAGSIIIMDSGFPQRQ